MQPSGDPPQQPDLHDDDHNGLTFEIIEDEHTHEGQKVRRRGVYLLPNLITTAALFSGFYAILASSNGHFEKAILAIGLAALFDGLDGRTARLLNAQSPFGEQYDSLSDMLSFGVAPAMLVYHWTLAPLGRLGMAVAFIYTACAAFRLARFNVQIASVDKRYFVGLPSPLAAILLSSAIWFALDWPQWIAPSSMLSTLLYGALTVGTGLLMVSNIRYFSFKELDRKRVPFYMMIPLVLILSLVTYNFAVGLFALSVVYGLSGLWMTWRLRQTARNHAAS